MKISWKREEAVAVEGVWDMGEEVIMEESRMVCIEVNVETRDGL